jgi:RimJ/RimL family protein N-acetyltransferase
MIEGNGVRLRRARPVDAEFLAELLAHAEVEPFLSARRARDPDSLRAEIERSHAEPEDFGRFVIEVQDGRKWRRAGICGFEVENKRSRIARLGGLAVHPDFRGRRLADEAARLFQRHLLFDLGYHRLQLEIYGFNERAVAHAERVGFVHEGTRRKAYWRHGDWVDGLMYGLIAEDYDRGIDLLSEHVERFNAGVRTGDFEPMLELFTEDAELAFEGVPIGPFTGREAIAAAYRERPPDDTIETLEVHDGENVIVAGYAWLREPDVRAGELRLTHEDGRIRRLVVTFE